MNVGAGSSSAASEERAADSTVASRVRAVMGFYRYHAARGVGVAGRPVRDGALPAGQLSAVLEHVARKHGRRSSVVRVRSARSRPCSSARADDRSAQGGGDVGHRPAGAWTGELRYRLLWTLLEETGLRLGEALGLRHRDWKTGTGTTAQVEVVHREDHPHGLRAKSGYRRIFIGSALDRLYGDWVWALCEAGADVELDDWDGAYIFCNLHRGRRFAPLRPRACTSTWTRGKRDCPRLPMQMTPHWYRHTHATALLLAGVPMHVVSRRLGHADIQTTINTYAHVTEDAELRACADWQRSRTHGELQ